MRANRDVVEAFINGEVLHNANMISTGDRLFSYNTCIAEKYKERGLDRCAINETTYSVTTTKHHNLLMRCMQIPYIVLTDIPIGTQTLKQYCIYRDL